MRSARSFRLFAVVVAVGSLAAIPFSSPASAATGASCTKLASAAPVTVKGVSMSHATLTGCTPLAVTGGSGKSVTNLKTLVSTTTWAGGKGTTIEKVTYKAQATKGKCPAGTASRILSTAIVIGGSGAALKVITKGQKGSASACITAKDVATLEPGTKYVF